MGNSCEERILDHLNGRLEDMPEDYCEDCQEQSCELDHLNSESVLEVSKSVVYKVLLSTGGPADWFNVYIDPIDNEIDRIEYVFQDWFDGAVRTLDSDQRERVENWIHANVYLEEIH